MLKAESGSRTESVYVWRKLGGLNVEIAIKRLNLIKSEITSHLSGAS